MILTVTPNPSLDLLYEADRLRWDDANRIPEPRRRPGGQGINAARAAAALGGTATAVAVLGGPTGAELADALTNEGIDLVRIDSPSATRVFIGIRESDTRRSLLLNTPGPVRAPGESETAISLIAEAIAARRPSWVACCGSVPPGYEPDFYARVAKIAGQHGARFVPDCDGPALRLAAAGADLLVPNHHEAGRLIGLDAGDTGSAARAARAIHDQLDVPLVAITLGERGSVLHDGRETWAARPPVVGGSAVGAGDAFLAALLLALEKGSQPPDAVRFATAAGAAAVAATGTRIIDTDRLGHLTDSVNVWLVD